MRGLATMLFGITLVLIVALFVSERRHARATADSKQQVALWQSRYAEASLESRRVVDTVRREVVKTRTLRDSLIVNLTDTVRIQEFIYRVDTLLVSCERCAQSLQRLRLTSDSTIRALEIRVEQVKPTLAQRAWPVWLGVGVLAGAWLRGQ